MKRVFYIFLMLLFPFLFIPGCSSDNIAGTGTETSTKSATAKVSGIVVGQSGRPVENAVVHLVPSDYDPVLAKSTALASDITDADGRYYLQAADSGKYNLEVFQLSSSTKALVRDIQITEDTIDVPDAKLGKTGAIKVALPKHIDPVHGYIYIEGTTIKQEIGQDLDSIVITGIPSAEMPKVYYAQEGDPSESALLGVNINVLADETTTVFKALFVVGDAEHIRENDSIVKMHLQKIGGNVICISDECLCLDEDQEVDIIVISSSTSADTVNGFFRELTIPVIVFENDIYGDMMLTGPESGKDYSNLYNPGAMGVNVKDVVHPIAGDYAGYVQVFDTLHAIAWGVPSSEATVIAACDEFNDKAALFCYEKGAQMVGMRAPARRAGFFADFYSSVINLNDDGWNLFKNTVLWSIGRLK
ncbi:MAG: hypothetical protein GF401_17525 [Chitinivibrionales bacterium]|nr:hypothetical protein [Chitinivibrionales bacterium]